MRVLGCRQHVALCSLLLLLSTAAPFCRLIAQPLPYLTGTTNKCDSRDPSRNQSIFPARVPVVRVMLGTSSFPFVSVVHPATSSATRLCAILVFVAVRLYGVLLTSHTRPLSLSPSSTYSSDSLPLEYPPFCNSEEGRAHL